MKITIHLDSNEASIQNDEAEKYLVSELERLLTIIKERNNIHSFNQHETHFDVDGEYCGWMVLS